MSNDLTLIVEKMELAPEQSRTLLDGFGELFVQAHKLSAQSKAIKVTREDQVEEMAKAKEFRIKLMKVRTEAEKIKKAIKEPYLRGAQASQDIYNSIKKITEPEELRLKEQEKFAELAEAKRVEERHSKRIERLSLYVDDVSVYALKDMPDDVFEALLADNKKVYDAKIAAEKEAQKARGEQEKKEAIKRERQLILAPYSDFFEDEPDWDMSEGAFGDFLKNLKNKKAEKEAEQEKIRQENEKLQAAKEEAEQKQKEAEEKLQKEKEDQERKEREANEAKEKAEREAREVEEEAKRKALLAPDKDKLIELATTIDLIKFPAVNSAEAGDIIRKANGMLDEVSKFIREKAKGL
jgi:hypothetical protein